MILSDTPTTYQLVPPGQYIAVCVDVVDLGVQKTTWQGKEKEKPMVRVVFEIPAVTMDDGRPMTISRRFTASLNETSALRQFLQTWRGQPFTPAELAAFDTDVLVGKAALIQVSHSENNGRTYDNIDNAIMRPLPGMALPKPSGKYVRVQDRPAAPPQGSTPVVHAPAPVAQPRTAPPAPQRAAAVAAASPVPPPHDDNDLVPF